jgi:hypothetical protein
MRHPLRRGFVLLAAASGLAVVADRLLGPWPGHRERSVAMLAGVAVATLVPALWTWGRSHVGRHAGDPRTTSSTVRRGTR